MEKEIVEDEIDLRDYLRVLGKQKFLIAGIIIVALISSVFYSFVMLQNEYQTNAVLYFKALPGDLSNVERYSNPVIVASTITSNDMIAKTVEKSGLTGIEPFRNSENPKEAAIGWLKGNIQVTPKAKLTSPLSDKEMEVTLKGTLDPEILQKTLSAHIELVVDENKKEFAQDVERDIKKLDDSIDLLKKQKASSLNVIGQIPQVNKSETSDSMFLLQNFMVINSRLNILDDKLITLEISRNNLEAVATPDFNFMEVVSTPYRAVPVASRAMLNIAIAGVLGLFIGVFAAFFKNYMEGSTSR